MSDRKPLLSICIPTYNRSSFLRVMLQALLPQVAECGDQVEVWVLDNASLDDTQAVIEESRKLGPFQSCRNESNIGPLQNVVKGPCELATGEFVWILGDHNLMRPGALQRVLGILSDNPNVSLFYSNFRVTKYPDNWPLSAIGGHEGPYHYPGNANAENQLLPEWHQLLTAANYFGTQVYVHIVKTSLWLQYWCEDPPAASWYFDGRSTYPHTYMIATRHFKSPVFYMGTEQITIFNGAQSWGDFPTQRKVYFYGLTDLIELFSHLGMNASRTADARRCCQMCVHLGFLEAFRSSGGRTALILFQSLKMAGVRKLYLWPPILKAWMSTRCEAPLQCWGTITQRVRRCMAYCTRDCRPARWLRGRR